MQQLINRLVNAILGFFLAAFRSSATLKQMPPPTPYPVGTPPTPPPIPVPEIPKALASSPLALRLDGFIVAYRGKHLTEASNKYGAQCVVLIDYWCRFLGIETFPGNAADFQFDRHPDCSWTPNGPTNHPPAGAIVVWRKSPTLIFGHVGIAIIADAMHLTSFDQNWPIGSGAHAQAHSYAGVAGWLTPLHWR